MASDDFMSLVDVHQERYVVSYGERIQTTTTRVMLAPGAQIVLAIATAAIDYIKSKNDSDWKSNVDEKLTDIANKIDVVIDELRAMRVWLPEFYREETRQIYVEEINVLRLDSTDITAGNDEDWNKETRSRLITIITQLKYKTDLLANWGRHGFAHYTGVFNGAATAIHLMDILKLPSTERKSYARRMRAYFEAAIDPKNPKSFESARQSAALEAINASQTANSRLALWWLTNHDFHGGDTIVTDGYDRPEKPDKPNRPAKPFHKWRTLLINGSLAQGFGLEGAFGEGQNPPTANWFSGIPRYSFNQQDEANRAVMAIMNGYRDLVISRQQHEAELAAHIKAIREIIKYLSLA